MSAFICDKKTFQNIYSGIKLFEAGEKEYRSEGNFDKTNAAIASLLEGYGLTALIAALYAANVRAVNQRYGETMSEEMPAADLLQAITFNSGVSVYQFARSVSCLQYQMSEGTVVTTGLYRRLRVLMDAVCTDAMRENKQYLEAEWN